MRQSEMLIAKSNTKDPTYDDVYRAFSELEAGECEFVIYSKGMLFAQCLLKDGGYYIEYGDSSKGLKIMKPRELLTKSEALDIFKKVERGRTVIDDESKWERVKTPDLSAAKSVGKKALVIVFLIMSLLIGGGAAMGAYYSGDPWYYGFGVGMGVVIVFAVIVVSGFMRDKTKNQSEGKTME